MRGVGQPRTRASHSHVAGHAAIGAPFGPQVRPKRWKAMTLPRQPGLDPQLALRLDDPKRGVLGGVRPAHPAGYSCLVLWSELSDNPWDAQTPAELRSRLAATVPGLTRFDRAEVEHFLARRPGREHHIMVSPAFHDRSGHVALLGGRLCWKMHPPSTGSAKPAPSVPRQRQRCLPEQYQRCPEARALSGSVSLCVPISLSMHGEGRVGVSAGCIKCSFSAQATRRTACTRRSRRACRVASRVR